MSTLADHTADPSSPTGAVPALGPGRAHTWVRAHDLVMLAAVSVSMVLWGVTGVPIIPIRPWVGSYMLKMSPLVVLGLVSVMIPRFVARARRRPRVDGRLSRLMLARHFGKDAIINVLRYMISFHIVFTVYTSIKQAIPLMNPGLYDPSLVVLERVIHLGFNPAWLLAESHVPGWWVALLDRCYYLWFPIKPLVLAYFLTHRNRTKREHFLAAYLAIWIIGVLVGLAWPSHGPCYVDAGRFPASEMPLCDNTQKWLGMNYAALEGITAGGDGRLVFGCGLMAMPSLHVTVCALYVIFLWREGRMLRWISLVYAALIFAGSLYSGWHYAVDGYAGVGIALLATALTGRAVIGRGSRRLY